jgi:hypothetical protein
MLHGGQAPQAPGAKQVWRVALLEWSALLASALIIGLAKAGFGSGVGVLAVPVTALAIGPERMLGSLLPVLLVGDVLSVIHYPRTFDRRNLRALLPGCAVGVAGGVLSLEWFRGLPNGGEILGGMIGALCLVFVGMQVRLVLRRSAARRGPVAPRGGPSSAAGGPGRGTGGQGSGEAAGGPGHDEKDPPYAPRAWHGLLAGLAAGLTSTLSHGAGPVMAMFLLPQRLEKRVYVGTTVIFFFATNLMKLGPYAWLGVVRAESVSYLPYLVPVVLAGTVLGLFLNRRLSPRAFSAAVYCLVFLAGLRLVARLFGV